MNKRIVRNCTRLALVSLVTLAGFGAAQADPTCSKGTLAGTPRINAQHIFCGEVSAPDVAKGFHSRPGGVNPDSVSNAPAGTHGAGDVYTLKNFTIAEGARSGTKSISTMFPDRCTEQQVIAAVRNAYATKVQDASNKSKYVGSSGTECQKGTPAAAFDIVFYLNGDLINTAYPKP
ncbi:TPA: EndoU domain-containing protein [Pseudomonas putida]|nr:EndoU domain-containing protein [Pseudomonas putida]